MRKVCIINCLPIKLIEPPAKNLNKSLIEILSVALAVPCSLS